MAYKRKTWKGKLIKKIGKIGEKGVTLPNSFLQPAAERREAKKERENWSFQSAQCFCQLQETEVQLEGATREREVGSDDCLD